MDTFDGRFWKNAFLRHFLFERKFIRFLMVIFRETLLKRDFLKIDTNKSV